ncbi:MAG: alkaline phosphatase family protein [Thalassobaculales bacterium]
MNVLLITADQWRGDCLSSLGHPAARTPNLDRLAAGGVHFTRHYANAAPCGPSRASLLTGLYAHNHRAIRNGTPLDARHTNLALELRKAGYRPVLFGYTDTTPDPRGLPAADPSLTSYEQVLAGFEPGHFLPAHQAAWLAHLKRRGIAIPGPEFAIYQGRPGDAAPFAAEDSETAWLTDRVIDHLDMALDAPWFVHVSYLRPHPPWIAPAPWNSLIGPEALPPPRRRFSPEAEAATHPVLGFLHATNRLEKYWPDGRGLVRDLDPETEALARATYLCLMAEADHHIGRLLDWLAASGQGDDTLVVLTSDHGEQWGDQWLFGKHAWFDSSFHIPLIVSGPGIVPGRVDRFTESVDVMPTILDLLGLPIPDQCDGLALSPFLAGGEPEAWRDAAHWSFDLRDVREKEAERWFSLPSDRLSLMVRREAGMKYVHCAALPPLLLGADDLSVLEDTGECLRMAQAMLSFRLAHEYGALDRLAAGPGGIRRG